MGRNGIYVFHMYKYIYTHINICGTPILGRLHSILPGMVSSGQYVGEYPHWNPWKNGDLFIFGGTYGGIWYVTKGVIILLVHQFSWCFSPVFLAGSMFIYWRAISSAMATGFSGHEDPSSLTNDCTSVVFLEDLFQIFRNFQTCREHIATIHAFCSH